MPGCVFLTYHLLQQGDIALSILHSLATSQMFLITTLAARSILTWRELWLVKHEALELWKLHNSRCINYAENGRSKFGESTNQWFLPNEENVAGFIVRGSKLLQQTKGLEHMKLSCGVRNVVPSLKKMCFFVMTQRNGCQFSVIKRTTIKTFCVRQ